MHTLLSLRDDESVMKIAVTRLAGKEGRDAARCAAYGHACYSVHPLRSEIQNEVVSAFVEAVERGEFDCLFFTSALPAKILAPLLKKTPRVIAIGPETARELERCRIACETLPGFYSRDFVPYLGDWIRGKTIGLPGPMSRTPPSSMRLPTREENPGSSVVTGSRRPMSRSTLTRPRLSFLPARCRIKKRSGLRVRICW